MRYLGVQADAFIKSFNIKNYFKIIGVILVKYLILTVFFYFMVLSLNSVASDVKPLLDVLYLVKSSGDISPDIAKELFTYKPMFDAFLWKSIALAIITIVMIVIIMSLSSSFTISYIRDHLWDKKIFMHLSFSYLISTLFFFSFLFLFIIKSQNLIWLVILSYITIILYIYSLTIFQISSNKKETLINDFKDGLKNFIRLNWSIPMMIMTIILMILALLVIVALLYLIRLYSIPIILLIVFSLEAWITNYFHTLYKMNEFIRE